MKNIPKLTAILHPKECRFLKNIGYCKFGEWCLFSHNIRKDPNIEKLDMEDKNIKRLLKNLRN